MGFYGAPSVLALLQHIDHAGSVMNVAVCGVGQEAGLVRRC